MAPVCVCSVLASEIWSSERRPFLISTSVKSPRPLAIGMVSAENVVDSCAGRWVGEARTKLVMDVATKPLVLAHPSSRALLQFNRKMGIAATEKKKNAQAGGLIT